MIDENAGLIVAGVFFWRNQANSNCCDSAGENCLVREVMRNNSGEGIAYSGMRGMIMLVDKLGSMR